MSKPTAIPQAISQVIRANKEPMAPRDIYDAIIAARRYTFKAQDPLSIVKTQLRRHCEGLNFPSARAVKYFAMTKDGKYRLLPKPIRVPPTLFSASNTPNGKPGP